MRFEDSLDSELTAIKLFLDEVPPFLFRRAAAAQKSADAGAYRAAIAIALDSTVHAFLARRPYQ